MFIAALVTRKQPKCPSSEEWMKTTWYMLTLECYSVTKRNEIRSFVEMWMDLKAVIQSKVSQKEKNNHIVKSLDLKKSSSSLP